MVTEWQPTMQRSDLFHGEFSILWFSCLQLEVPFSAPMMLIFGGKGFEHVKEMEMALKFRWISRRISFKLPPMAVCLWWSRGNLDVLAKMVLTSDYPSTKSWHWKWDTSRFTHLCAKTERALPIAQDCLLRDRSMDSSIPAPGSCNRPIDLSFLRAALKSRLEVRSCMLHLCKSLQWKTQMVTARKIICTSLADFKSIQSECCGCGCDGPLFW